MMMRSILIIILLASIASTFGIGFKSGSNHQHKLNLEALAIAANEIDTENNKLLEEANNRAKKWKGEALLASEEKEILRDKFNDIKSKNKNVSRSKNCNYLGDDFKRLSKLSTKAMFEKQNNKGNIKK